MYLFRIEYKYSFINFNKNKLSIEGDEYDKLIYTGDVRKLVDFFDINDENLKSEIKK